MTTKIENSDAIEKSSVNNHAIFIKNLNGQRYAFAKEGLNYITLKEQKGYWEVHPVCLVTWAIWNADFQGYDDLADLIK